MKVHPSVIEFTFKGGSPPGYAPKVSKHASRPEMKKVGIAPDMTQKQREENKLLREELIARRRQGGRWIIKQGKVIEIFPDQDRE